jgi:hypothetical protein
VTGDLFQSVPQTHRAFRTNGPTSASTFCDRLAAFLKAQPNRWVDGRTIATIAGYYAWRSRVSDLRRPPYSLNIVNRLRRAGRTTISEYMLVVAAGHDLGGAA